MKREQHVLCDTGEISHVISHVTLLVYTILDKAQGGITVRGKTISRVCLSLPVICLSFHVLPPSLPSSLPPFLPPSPPSLLVHTMMLKLPTVQELSANEKNFAIRVEEFLTNITMPEYRQMVVEVRHCAILVMYDPHTCVSMLS